MELKLTFAQEVPVKDLILNIIFVLPPLRLNFETCLEWYAPMCKFYFNTPAPPSPEGGGRLLCGVGTSSLAVVSLAGCWVNKTSLHTSDHSKEFVPEMTEF